MPCGIPGCCATLTNSTSPEALKHRLHRVEGAHAHAAAGHDDVGLAERGVENGAELGVDVVRRAARVRQALARRRARRATSMTPLESTICPSCGGAGLDELVAGADHHDVRPAYDADVGPPDGGQHRDRPLGDDVARPQHDGALRARRRRGGARRRRRSTAARTRTVAVPPSVRLDRDDGVGTRWHRCAGHDADRGARRRRRARRRSRRPRRRARRASPGSRRWRASDVGGAHGVAVHRAVVERRQRPRRDDVRGEHLPDARRAAGCSTAAQRLRRRRARARGAPRPISCPHPDGCPATRLPVGKTSRERIERRLGGSARARSVAVSGGPSVRAARRAPPATSRLADGAHAPPRARAASAR